MKKARIEPVSADLVRKGDSSTILELLWRLIKKFRVKIIKHSKPETPEKALLTWCQRQTENYPSCGANIVDFDQSWMSVLPFVALMHGKDPKNVPFDTKRAPAAVCGRAFRNAEKMGVPRILDASDVCGRTTRPDKRVVLTYVAEMYHVLNKK